jgi:hypothetical protein
MCSQGAALLRLQVPCLTYGMRGMIAASVEVKGPSRDLHSGNEGGALQSSLRSSSACPLSLSPSPRFSFAACSQAQSALVAWQHAEVIHAMIRLSM